MKIRTRTGMRLLVAGALAVPAVALAAPNAHATVHVITANPECVGQQVLRCLELRYDDVNRRYRAWASIWDNGNLATQYDVDVTAVAVSPGGSSGAVGYQPTVDSHSSPLVGCSGRPQAVGFAATFRWRNAATGATDSETRSAGATICQ
jgi:hypothetical protein